MSNSSLWWLLSGAIVAVELLTGTFYLLMIAVGTACAAVAAQWGASAEQQLLLASVVALLAVGLWHGVRSRQVANPPATANKDVNLDIGETITVAHWQADRAATVKYRGAEWAATLVEGVPAHPGKHRIVEVRGSCLVLAPLLP